MAPAKRASNEGSPAAKRARGSGATATAERAAEPAAAPATVEPSSSASAAGVAPSVVVAIPNSPSPAELPASCPVCLQVMSVGDSSDPICSMACGHVLHMYCRAGIMEQGALATGDLSSLKCPVCKKTEHDISAMEAAVDVAGAQKVVQVTTADGEVTQFDGEPATEAEIAAVSVVAPDAPAAAPEEAADPRPSAARCEP